MVTRITAEFDTPDIAENAVHSIYRNVRGIYSANLMRKHSGTTGFKPAQSFTNLAGDSFSDIKTDSNVRPSSIYIVCDGSNVDEIHALLSSIGAKNIDP